MSKTEQVCGFDCIRRRVLGAFSGVISCATDDLSWVGAPELTPTILDNISNVEGSMVRNIEIAPQRVFTLSILLVLGACGPSSSGVETPAPEPAPLALQIETDRFQRTITLAVPVHPIVGVPLRSRPRDLLNWGVSVVVSEEPGTDPRAYHHFWALKWLDGGSLFNYFSSNRTLIVIADSERLVRGQDLYRTTTWDTEMRAAQGFSLNKAMIQVPLDDLRTIATAISVEGQVGAEFNFTFDGRQQLALQALLASVDSVLVTIQGSSQSSR